MYDSNKLYNESGFKKEDEAKSFILSLKDKKVVDEDKIDPFVAA